MPLEEATPANGMEASPFLVVAAFVLLAAAFIGAYTPMGLAGWGRSAGETAEKSIVSVLGNMLSAGVVLSAGLVHLLGDSATELRSVTKYPIAAFLCGIGFVTTLSAEVLMVGIPCDHLVPTQTTAICPRCMAAQPHEAEAPGTFQQGARLPHLVSPMSPGQQAICSPAGVQGYCPSNTLDSEATDDGQGTSSADPLVCGSHDYIQSTFFCNSSQHDHVTAVGPTLTGGRLPWHAADGNLSRYCHGRMTPPIAADGSSRDSRQGLAWSLGSQSYPSQVSPLNATMMAVIMCMHSILEGAALGSQQEVSKALNIFVPTIAHKGLTAYALGSSILSSNASKERALSFICMFAFATPIGIFIGYLMATSTHPAGAAAISSLASGTFLYISTMEIIPKGLSGTKFRPLKLIVLISGFGVMSVLAMFT